jgi:hypothetical protein
MVAVLVQEIWCFRVPGFEWPFLCRCLYAQTIALLRRRRRMHTIDSSRCNCQRQQLVNLQSWRRSKVLQPIRATNSNITSDKRNGSCNRLTYADPRTLCVAVQSQGILHREPLQRRNYSISNAGECYHHSEDSNDCTRIWGISNEQNPFIHSRNSAQRPCPYNLRWSWLFVGIVGLVRGVFALGLGWVISHVGFVMWLRYLITK